MDSALWIWPECRQGGGGLKSQKLCRRHLSMAPNLDSTALPTAQSNKVQDKSFLQRDIESNMWWIKEFQVDIL